jgi:hypothetical protein
VKRSRNIRFAPVLERVKAVIFTPIQVQRRQTQNELMRMSSTGGNGSGSSQPQSMSSSPSLLPMPPPLPIPIDDDLALEFDDASDVDEKMQLFAARNDRDDDAYYSPRHRHAATFVHGKWIKTSPPDNTNDPRSPTLAPESRSLSASPAPSSSPILGPMNGNGLSGAPHSPQPNAIGKGPRRMPPAHDADHDFPADLEDVDLLPGFSPRDDNDSSPYKGIEIGRGDVTVPASVVAQLERRRMSEDLDSIPDFDAPINDVQSPPFVLNAPGTVPPTPASANNANTVMASLTNITITSTSGTSTRLSGSNGSPNSNNGEAAVPKAVAGAQKPQLITPAVAAAMLAAMANKTNGAAATSGASSSPSSVSGPTPMSLATSPVTSPITATGTTASSSLSSSISGAFAPSASPRSGSGSSPPRAGAVSLPPLNTNLSNSAAAAALAAAVGAVIGKGIPSKPSSRESILDQQTLMDIALALAAARLPGELPTPGAPPSLEIGSSGAVSGGLPGKPPTINEDEFGLDEIPDFDDAPASLTVLYFHISFCYFHIMICYCRLLYYVI